MYSFHLVQDSNGLDTNIKVYINFQLVDEFEHINAPLNSVANQMQIGGNVRKLFGIIYQIWWFIGVEYITEIISLVTTINGSYCISYPQAVCLPPYESTYNIEGVECPNTCTDYSLSCERDFSCIQNYSSSCKYGLYDIESKDCIFYCPEDSCDCSFPTIAGKISLSFSCKSGFSKVSDNPPACISSSCLVYHQEGYRYPCDQCDVGLRVGCNGDCCECDEGYSLISIDPLACINLDVCLEYEYNGSKYICLDCAAGYVLSQIGDCDSCEVGYVRVSDDPIVCIQEIKNCIKYTQEGSISECQGCGEGYKLDNNQECSECEAEYISIVLEDSVACAREIERCIEYDISSNLDCKVCEAGYTLDQSKQCKDCELGYFRVDDSIICILNEDQLDSDSGILCPETPKECTSEYSDCEICQYTIPKVTKEDSDSNAEISSSARTAAIVVIGSAIVTSVLTLDASTLIELMNTIKLLSYLRYISVPIPSQIRKQQTTTYETTQDFNLLSYIGYQGDNLSDSINDDYSYIMKFCYEILGLIILFALNLIIYLMERYGKGKIKTLGSKLLIHFKYTVYIHYWRLVYLDSCVYGFAKLIHPKESKLVNILDYDLAFLMGVRSI